MSTEPSCFAGEGCLESEDVKCKQKWKSASDPTGDSKDNGDCFDCHICLDSAHDPVVTLCGHLYCWSCIYKWLHVKSSSPDSDEQRCPVCKANISPNSLIPLYGHGKTQTDSRLQKASTDSGIPRRPHPASNDQLRQLHPNFFQSQSQPRSLHHQEYFPNPFSGGSGAMASSVSPISNPVDGIIGELMFARIFGTSGPSLFAYSYPNYNPVTGAYNQRMRRHEMQLEKSLNRVTIFLLCCVMLCLLLF